MNNRRKFKQILLLLLAGMALFFSGCSRLHLKVSGTPIEPITPGEENQGENQALKGRFAIRNTETQILDLSVTENGALAAVGSASRSVYLLERDGRLRWERVLNSLPLKMYLEPSGKFLVVGTSGGKVIMFNIDQTVRFEQNLGAPVGLLSVSGDGELLLAGLLPEEEKTQDKIVALDKLGRTRWEKQFEIIHDARVSGIENRIFLSWQEGDTPVIGAFNADGESIWQARGRSLIAVPRDGSLTATSNGKQVFLYSAGGSELWSYTAAGTIRKLIFSANGLYLAALVRDEATRQEELLYLDTEGNLLFSQRLPDDSEVLLSRDGMRLIVASWRQYRDDATNILIYSNRGREINTLEVAGRVQRLDLQTHTLALGLEDGSIYFLSLQDGLPQKGEKNAQEPDKTLLTFYKPVVFGREKDETALSLFFYNQDAQALVPVTRRIKSSQSVLRASLDELIRGPVQGSYLQRTIPKDAEVGVTLHEGVASLDLPVALNEMAGNTFLSGILDSLLLTVSQFPTVDQVRFTVGGKEQDSFGHEGILIKDPFPARPMNRVPGERLVFLPAKSGARYYLLPVSRELLPLTDSALAEALVSLIQAEAPEYFPGDTKLMGVWFEGHTAFLDFSSEFALLMASDSPEIAARAAILRDAVALTLAENLPFTNIRFLINAKPIEKQSGFLPWEITVSLPYYINQEE